MVLDYANMKLRDLPGKVFPKDYLKKLHNRSPVWILITQAPVISAI